MRNFVFLVAIALPAMRRAGARMKAANCGRPLEVSIALSPQHGHDSLYSLVGSVMENVAPRGELSAVHRRPPVRFDDGAADGQPIPSP